MVNEFGFIHGLDSFMETVELIDYLMKGPELVRKSMVSDRLAEAYLIAVGEWEAFEGRQGE